MLFDGVCNLCNASVQFMIDRDPKKRTSRFAAIQSDVAHDLVTAAVGAERAEVAPRASSERKAGRPRTPILYVADGKLFTHSSAALRIAGKLAFPWSWLAAFWIVPRPIRDWFYRFIARNRYRWFGKSDTCRIPTPELKARFLA